MGSGARETTSVRTQSFSISTFGRKYSESWNASAARTAIVPCAMKSSWSVRPQAAREEIHDGIGGRGHQRTPVIEIDRAPRRQPHLLVRARQAAEEAVGQR